MMSLTVLGLDPGTRHCGWAILQGERLEGAGVLHPDPTRTPLVRHQWLCQELQALVQAAAPALVAYEEFTWRAHERIDVRQTAWVHRLIGVICCLGQTRPFPTVVPLQPQEWGQQLTGSRTHTKAQIAQAVNLRLCMHLTGSQGGHDSDAVGIALVALDQAQHIQRLARAPRQ